MNYNEWMSGSRRFKERIFPMSCGNKKVKATAGLPVTTNKS